MAEHHVAALHELGEDGLKAVEAGGTKVMLARVGGRIHAVGATCPHAGANLAEGVLCGARVICPWHKATFDVTDGALLDPPAVDRLPSFPVRMDGNAIYVTVPDQPASAPPPARDEADQRCFAIVGGGAAGALAAQTLREEGFTGRVVLIDAANRVPYDRTILSKYHLSGEKGAEKSPLRSQAEYAALGVERRTGTVKALDAATREITLDDGERLRFDAALVATGGKPTWTDLPGATLANVFTLRSRDDADRILAQAERSRRAAVLGASFIGLEVAASLRQRGLEVTVIAAEATPLERKLGPEVGGVFRTLHERKGVVLRLGAKVAALTGADAGGTVRLEDGGSVEADLVVIGHGVRPETAFLKNVPRLEDGGVPVDATLRVADGVFAAGDIAAFPHRGDGAPIRVEHWRVAEQHGRLAARNMLGAALPYASVPVFWTIQYGQRLDYIGHAETWDELAIAGDLSEPRFLAFYGQGGRVAAVAGWGRDRDMAALLHLLTLRRDWPMAVLVGADPVALLRQESAG